MNYESNTYHTTTENQPSLGDLFSTLSDQVSLLFRQEVQLAQAEMTKKVSRAGQNASYIVLGAVIGQAAFLAIVAAIILALSLVMEAWLAALLVGIGLAIAAILLVQTGINKLKTMDPAPRQTIETMKENKEWLTRQI